MRGNINIEPNSVKWLKLGYRDRWILILSLFNKFICMTGSCDHGKVSPGAQKG